MGVHGLTTFLREHQRVLAKRLQFPVQDGAETPLIVDGWSLIYKLIQDTDLPWVYGGEYAELSRTLTKVVEAWLSVGLKPIFVFDGPTPPAKFATVISRTNQSQVQGALLFFRTSPTSRSSRRFLHESRIIPPLAYTACVQALRAFRFKSNNGDEVTARELDIHFADEEGDPYAVELAGRVEGYVTGRDSDFVVLNSEGYRGYIPLDEMIWLAPESGVVELAGGEEDGFRPIKSKRKNGAGGAVGLGIIPPDLQDLSLSFTVYTPASLAQHLNLPVSLLPLLGALVGNDFTLQASFPTSSASPYTPTATPSSSPPPPASKSFHNLLFERRLNPSQRITHVGTTLASLLHPKLGKKKQKAPQSVMELIQMTVAALLGSSHAPPSLIGSGEQTAIIERIVEGTLPYAIPPRPFEDEQLERTVCSLHTAPTCPLVTLLDRTEDERPRRADIASLYLRAYRLGDFSPSLLDVLSTRSFWPELFLENPDVEAVARTVSRPVRTFGYAVLEDGIGLPEVEDEDEFAEDDEIEGEREEDLSEDLDEVIEVMEEESDCEDDLSDVDKLRVELRGLQVGEDQDAYKPKNGLTEGPELMASEDDESSTHSSSARSPVALSRFPRPKKQVGNQPKTVAEYVRRGARIVAEEVEVSGPGHFTFSSGDGGEAKDVPIPLQSKSKRFDALLQFLQADLEVIRALDAENLLPVLALRLVVRRMHERSVENATSKERQLERWTRKEAQAFLAAISASFKTNFASLGTPEVVSERAIQLMAQISTALECIEHLVQILLLTGVVPACAHRLSGRLFHGLLAVPGVPACDEHTWSATEEELEDCFAEERKGKKGRRKVAAAAQLPPPPSANARGKLGGMYSLLADMDM